MNVSVSGLSPGATASPSTFTISSGSPQQVTFAAQASAPAATVSLTVQGVSGNLSHSLQIAFSVQSATSSMHAPVRSRYLRTDAFYDPNSLQDSPPHFTAYDQPLRRFFVSNPFLNRIDVFDAAQEYQIGSIVVPFAWGIDTSSDGTKLYAGTLIGDVYEIDPSALQVIQRFPASTIGPNGFSASETFVLSDGSLVLLGPMLGLPLDGEGSFAIWDPVSNSIDIENGASCGVYNIGAFALSGDRTKILMGSIDSDGTVCSYDPNTDQGVSGSVGTYLSQIEPTPDGKSFFVTGESGVLALFDVVSGQQEQEIQTSNDNYGTVLSLDGSTLYLVDSYGTMEAYDTSSLALKGWVPNYFIADSQSAIVPGAADETGLIIGPIGHGVAFVDAALFQAGTLPPQVGISTALPATGPLSGGAQVQVGTSTGVQNTVPGLTQAYVGNSVLTGAKEVVLGQNQDPTIEGAVAASSVGGAADFTATFQNNNVAISPETYSYGPTIVELTSNAATAEGGSIGTLVGYGLGQTASDVQVTVGGQTAPVVALYTGAPIEPYPFPIEGLVFTVPPGTAGNSVDVTVTTTDGSVTAGGAFYYVAATSFYPLTATLQQGIYDSYRNLYYFTDQAEIQVFSLTAGQWQAPISLPKASGNTQLLALSLSPDGSQLAISDYGEQAIYVLDPGQPNSAKEFHLPQGGVESGTTPSGLAITNNGIVYFATRDLNGTGAPGFHKLNTATGNFTDVGQLQSGGTSDEFIRVLLSPDGNRVYSNFENLPLLIDTGTDEVTIPFFNYLGRSTSDLAMSDDGTTLAIDGYLTDAFMNASSLVAYTDRETFFPTAVLGQKLSPNGSVLFQPLTNGIDVIDTTSGRLLYRVQVPVQISDTYDALVVDGTDNKLAAITSGGIAFFDLGALPGLQAMGERRERPHRAAQRDRVVEKSSQMRGTPERPHLQRRGEKASAYGQFRQ